MDHQSRLGAGVYSASRLKALVCPRKYYYSYEFSGCGIEGTEIIPTLHAGSIIHLALDLLYQNIEIDDVLKVVDREWGDYEPPPGHKHHFLTSGHIKNVLEAYHYHWWGKDRFTPVDVMVNGQRISSEMPVVAPVGAYQYGGFLDLPVRDQLGNLYVLDHKSTTGNMGNYFFSKFVVSNQLRGYAMLLQEVMGEPVAGAIINGIYMGKNSRKPDTAFQRKVFNFSKDSLEEEKDNIAAKIEALWIAQFLHANAEKPELALAWPQQEGRDNCTGCSFVELCKAPRALRSRIIERDFRLKDSPQSDDALTLVPATG